ncbi:tripartite tricarboxylate transporter TctB family protein [Pelagibacterium lacus]|nr:tripartite tricarboxylate transporter TctB family protein [Pelagibacterium lacus]
MIILRYVDLAVSLLLVAFGIYIVTQGLAFGYSDRSGVGAGFFPIWIGGGIAALSAVNFLKVVRNNLHLGTIEISEVVRVVFTSAAMLGFIYLSHHVGMIASILVLMLAIGAIYGPRSKVFYLWLLPICGVTTLFLYLIFRVLLGALLI